MSELALIEKWLPRDEESTARAKLRDLAADRDEGWRQHNRSEIARLDALHTLARADKLVSKIHDAIWAMDFQKTAAGHLERDQWERQRKQAIDLVWKLHDLIRPAIDRERGKYE